MKINNVLRKLGKKINEHRIGLAVGATAVAGNAMAAAGDIDTSTIVAYATAAGAAVTVVGTAVLGVKYGKKVFSWLSPN